MNSLTDQLHIISATFDRAALALILALALAALWLARPSTAAEKRRHCRLLMAALLISAVCAAAELLFRSAALADVAPNEAWSFIPRVLGHSDYGFYWQLRAAAWLVMLLLVFWLWRGAWSRLPSLLLLLAILFTALLLSTTGHAGEDGILSLPNIINWLHLIAISIWGGTVILYAISVFPARLDSPQHAGLVAARLSTLAGGALALVLLTGLYNCWRQLAELSDLWRTDYGQILLLKLILVAIMMAIGTMNRLRLVPQIMAWRDVAADQWRIAAIRFLKVLRIDSVIFMLILIGAVVLSMQTPPAHA